MGCRRRAPKSEFVRLVLGPRGEVVVDREGRRRGRGAYLCRDVEGAGPYNLRCFELANARGRLRRALRADRTRAASGRRR